MSCNNVTAIEDIEDIIKKNDLGPAERIPVKRDVLPKGRKYKMATSTEESVAEEPLTHSIIPGTQKIYIKTWGCSHNNSDSEYMAGQLAAYGYRIIGRFCFRVNNFNYFL